MKNKKKIIYFIIIVSIIFFVIPIGLSIYLEIRDNGLRITSDGFQAWMSSIGGYIASIIGAGLGVIGAYLIMKKQLNIENENKVLYLKKKIKNIYVTIYSSIRENRATDVLEKAISLPTVENINYLERLIYDLEEVIEELTYTSKKTNINILIISMKLDNIKPMLKQLKKENIKNIDVFKKYISNDIINLNAHEKYTNPKEIVEKLITNLEEGLEYANNLDAEYQKNLNRIKNTPTEKIIELINKWQIRKTYKQKSEFINWLGENSKELGYELKIDEYSKKGRNLIIGDVENSKVILGAHYDTQANFFLPMIMGINWLGFIVSQIVILAIIFGIVDIIEYLLSYIIGGTWANVLSLTLILFFLFQMTYGIANKHTVNDNTSGVATLLWIMEDLPKEDRDKICFVFFDQEEVGLIGSKNFKNKYGSSVQNKPLINFDCVSNGNNLAFIQKKAFIESEYSELLNESISKVIGNNNVDKKYLIGSVLKYIYPSDQLYFKQGVGVAALKKLPIFGYYLNGIHNSRDKVFMAENIKLLKDTMIDFIKKI